MKTNIGNSTFRASIKLILVIFCISFILFAFDIKKEAFPREKVTSNPSNKLEWFQEAKFGLFVHWGLYSVPASGEWVQFGRNIPGQEYEKFAKQFNPVKFNAKDWVSMAKQAGMKYIVITT